MKENNNIGVKAEWDKAEEILVSKPSQELFYGIIYPEAASFERPFSFTKAIAEHEQFTKEIESHGARIIQLEDVLLETDIEVLRNLAEKALEYVYYDSNKNRQYLPGISEKKQELIRQFCKKSLIKIILERPQVIQIQDKINPEKYHNDGYKIFPIMNLYFQRDPQITTDNGVVIGRMKNKVRRAETDIAEIVFGTLGITPIYKVQSPGVLEGGDYIPAGEFALIGNGLRTNRSAITQLLENRVLGFPEVAVVYDPYQMEDEMHLDTYFEFVGRNKALIVADRIDTPESKANPKKVPEVEVYRRSSNGNYVQQNQRRIPFQEYLVSKEVELIPVPKEVQMNYGINVLTLSDSKIIALKGLNPDYLALLQDKGIDVITIDATNLAKGYGGPHCMTQVLRRVSQ